jgi:hypothetical protein
MAHTACKSCFKTIVLKQIEVGAEQVNWFVLCGVEPKVLSFLLTFTDLYSAFGKSPLEVTSTSVSTGLNPFNFTVKAITHFTGIAL